MSHLRRIVLPSLLLGPVSLVLFGGCAVFPSAQSPGKRAFIAYWPPPEDSSVLRVAVKDNIDMKGVVTTAGSKHFYDLGKPAARDAACLAIARERGVTFVGKSNLSEFAVTPAGINEYFGTPKSPLSGWRSLIPGGSSCGSAVAVALGMADVGIGTDTAGSVRVPAACCGVVGLKTTFGLVSVKGVHPVEPKHLDTIGPIGRDIARTAQGMDLLQAGFAAKYEAAKTSQPTAQGLRVGRLKVKGTDPKIDTAVDEALSRAGFQVVPLGPEFVSKWAQAQKDGNTVAASGVWLSNQKYRSEPGIATRTKGAILLGKIAYQNEYWKALARQKAWQRTLAKQFRKVDFIALPTMQTTPLLIPGDLNTGLIDAVVLNLQNTSAVNFAGNPALAVPIPLRHSGVKFTSLQLVGPPRSEAELLNAGRLVEASTPKQKRFFFFPRSEDR